MPLSDQGVRSPRLLALSLGLLAASALTWSLDQAGGPAVGMGVEAVASESVGEPVGVAGTLAPFVRPAFPPPAWEPILDALDNHTALLSPDDGADPSLAILVTAPEALPQGHAELVGRIAHRGSYPGDADRTIAVIAVA